MSARVDRDGIAQRRVAGRDRRATRRTGARVSVRMDELVETRLRVSLLDMLAGDTYHDSDCWGLDRRRHWVLGSARRLLQGQRTIAPSISADETGYRSTELESVSSTASSCRSRQEPNDSVQLRRRHDRACVPIAGESWGPIWSRRKTRFRSTSKRRSRQRRPKDFWGGSSFEQATARLTKSRDGLLGLHANVGVTFDLQAIREREQRTESRGDAFCRSDHELRQLSADGPATPAIARRRSLLR